MNPSKPAAVAALWGLALLVSALLVAAGARWPEPLQPAAGPIVALLLGPPLLMGLGLLRGWRLQPGHPGRGESAQCTHGEG